MKKIILIFLFCLMPKLSFADYYKYNYPLYYGTKKCEIKKIEEKTKTYAYYNSLNESNYYIFNGDLYNNGKVYKKSVTMLLFEFSDKIIYGIKNGTKIDIYINDEKSVSVDEVYYRSLNYDNYIDRYNIEVWNNGKEYIFSNGILHLSHTFKYHKRYFSKNRKVFIDLYRDKSGFQLEKNGENIYEKKGNFHINDIAVSNDNINLSLFGNDYINKKHIFIKDGKDIDINHGNVTDKVFVKHIEYSPSGKDLYYITKINDNIIFYKNNTRLGDFKEQIFNNFSLKFINDNNFYVILTNWRDYAFIKNGKTIISFDSDIQIKLILKKENGDEFIVKRNKKTGIDTLYINKIKILEADDIDERYLNSGKGTFSLYSNKQKSDQYYTYITNDDYHYLFVNGFFIPNMYDYLRLEDGLDNFNFLSMDYRSVSCKDITYLYPNKKYSRGQLEKILLKIKGLSINKKEILIKKLEKLNKSQKSIENIELIKMFLDNLNNIK